MLRHSITKLRELGLAVILPLDRHIYFHKVTGRLIVVYSLIHTVAHLGNLSKYIFDINQLLTFWSLLLGRVDIGLAGQYYLDWLELAILSRLISLTC